MLHRVAIRKLQLAFGRQRQCGVRTTLRLQAALMSKVIASKGRSRISTCFNFTITQCPSYLGWDTKCHHTGWYIVRHKGSGTDDRPFSDMPLLQNCGSESDPRACANCDVTRQAYTGRNVRVRPDAAAVIDNRARVHNDTV
jgi:hypothetical protein